MVRFFPSSKPSVFNSAKNACCWAATLATLRLGPRMPMRQTLPACCARAASGHPATPLPRSAMNSRRLMGLSQGQGSRTKYSRCWGGSVGFSSTTLDEDRRLEVGPWSLDVVAYVVAVLLQRELAACASRAHISQESARS